MLDFKEPKITDKPWVDQCLSHAHSMNCEYTFGNIFVWRTAYVTRICHYKDFLLIRYGRGADIAYSPPVGTGDFADAVRVLQQDAAENGVTLRLLGVTASYKELLEADFPGKFNYTYSDDYNDYIYSVEKMANLSGKKYHGKRGHITYFMKAYPDWQFEVLTLENVGECIALHTSWIDEKDQTEQKEEDAEFSLEFEAVLSAFDNYKALGFVGGLIRVGGKVIAYTMGEPHSKDCFVTHFEKAPADMRGAFPIINQVFTRQCLSGYTYVNREEDLGLEGLRKAKQSYHPEIFLEKCVATYVDEN